MDYEKMWNTLIAESGYRWCQPHPGEMVLRTVGELMRNMERRAAELAEQNGHISQQAQPKMPLDTVDGN